MGYYLLALGWAATSLVIYWLVNRHLRERHVAAERERLGCKSPYIVKADLPLGLDHIWRAMQADKDKRFCDYLYSRWERWGGDHGFSILGRQAFMTADPKNIQAMLATQFNDFGLGENRRKNFLPMLGNGIFTTDGKMWEHSRQMMRPQFARDQVSDLDLEEDHVQNLWKALPTDAQRWTSEVDLQTLFFRLTLDSACEFLLGQSVDSQLLLADSDKLKGAVDPAKHKQSLNGKPDSAAFAVAFDRSQQWLATRSRLSHLSHLLDTADFRQGNKVCHEFIDYFVAIALKKSDDVGQAEKGLGGEKQRYVFLDALAAQTRDPIELRSQLLNILLAGRDTTASLLGWVFWELARRPELYASLRQTVLADFGTGTDRLSFSSLKACAPLQHVLMETLRLNPVVPVNSRQAERDTTLPRGGGPDGSSPIFIPKGTEVGYCVYIMHRRKDLWGPDALEFKPERWVNRRHGWEYLPFNGGPRICLGQQFALTEASYVTVRLLQRFDQIQNCDNSPAKHHLTLTDCPGGAGVRVRLHAAE